MAAPSFVAASTGATDAGGAWTATCHAPGAAGRIIVFQVLQDGSTNGAVGFFLTGTSNIDNLLGSGNVMTQVSGPNGDGSWPIGSPEVARQFIYIGRSPTTSAPTVSGSNSTSEDLYWRFYEFSNVSTGTTLATVIENSTAGNATNGAGTAASVTDTAVTTLGPDRLALNFVGINDDNAISALASSGLQAWGLPVAYYAESSGTDASIGLQAAWPGSICAGWGNSSQGFGISIVEAVSQQFATSGALTVAHVTLGLNKTNSPADNVIVEIQTDSGGLPSGTVVGSGATIAGSSLTTSMTSLRVAVSASLSASTTYHLVVRRSGQEKANGPVCAAVL